MDLARERYPSDLTDAQWARIAPIFTAFGRGRPRSVPAREILIDSTFIESAYGGGQFAPNGYKRATGHSIHLIIDKASEPLAVAILPANLQDAAGTRRLIPKAKSRFPSLRLVLLDGDFPPLPKGTIFRPMPIRWRIEQFFAWLCKWRRIARNWCFTQSGFACDVRWTLFGLSLLRCKY